jgi:protein SCO1/2
MDAQRRALLGLAPVAATTLSTPMTPAREAIRNRYFPDIVLQTHEGRALRFYQDLIKDRVVTLNFMYLNCEDGSCPITTHNLVHAQKRLKSRVGRDIFMYSITLDPERDTVGALKKHARTHGVGPGWLFLRASREDTETLRRKLGFYSRDPEIDAKKSNHAAMVRYGNEPRQLWSAVSGFASPQTIARSILWVAPKAPARSA